MPQTDIKSFQNTVFRYFEKHGRHDMPWRLQELDGSFDPYKIMVSELMLQQTQVARVTPKFLEFIQRFPTVQSLVGASLGDVLVAWSGLGYNRRAKFLHQAAQMVVREYNGKFPSDLEQLVRLPGVGKNTAGAILAYAFNRPALFIETNIRTVYIHHFFHDRTGIPDSEIIKLLDETLDNKQPRIFYWALMDYGAYLKQIIGNLNKLSKSYAKQSTFAGSLRQIRGQVIRSLAGCACTLEQLQRIITDDRLPIVLEDLMHENLIVKQADHYQLP